MTDLWTAVDDYLETTVLREDPTLTACLRASEAAGLPDIQVSPVQGRFLYLVAKLLGARRILEVGTLGGYSAVCLARALPPDGRMVTLELDPKHADVARANLARAGLSEKVEVRVGPALESLPKLEAEGYGPFDLFFLDADRPHGRAYLDWAVRHSRVGSVIVVDNVVRRGEVVNLANHDPAVEGMRSLLEACTTDDRLSATAMQTVGRKGHDGFLLARVELPGPPRRELIPRRRNRRRAVAHHR